VSIAPELLLIYFTERWQITNVKVDRRLSIYFQETIFAFSAIFWHCGWRLFTLSSIYFNSHLRIFEQIINLSMLSVPDNGYFRMCRASWIWYQRCLQIENFSLKYYKGAQRSKAITKTTFYKDRLRSITIPLYIKRNRPSRYYNNCLTGLCFNNNTTCIYLLLFEVVVYVTEHGRHPPPTTHTLNYTPEFAMFMILFYAYYLYYKLKLGIMLYICFLV
jgi:hypothetical protein